MSKDAPSPIERKLLTIVHRYINEHSELPLPGQLAEDFGERLNYLLNVIKRLERKKYIEKHGNLISITKKAEKYFSDALKPTRPNNVAPTQIQILGTVKAGRTTAEELEVDLSSDGDFV